MKPEIASLHDRMAAGGDWRTFRDEIAALHSEATTEEEYVTLLEAHRNLVEVGRFAFDDETYAKILPIAKAEYLMFLNKESMEGEIINPSLLERVTRREVEAGRLDAEDDLRKLAAAGATVLGDSAESLAHRCRRGDWFFFGMAGASVLALALQSLNVSALWIAGIGLAIGWLVNERERSQIKNAIAARRS